MPVQSGTSEYSDVSIRNRCSIEAPQRLLTGDIMEVSGSQVSQYLLHLHQLEVLHRKHFNSISPWALAQARGGH